MPSAEPKRLLVPEQDSLVGSFPTKLPVRPHQPCLGALSPDSPPRTCRRPGLVEQPVSSASASVLSEPEEMEVGKAPWCTGFRCGDTQTSKMQSRPKGDCSLEKGVVTQCVCCKEERPRLTEAGGHADGGMLGHILQARGGVWLGEPRSGTPLEQGAGVWLWPELQRMSLMCLWRAGRARSQDPGR